MPRPPAPTIDHPYVFSVSQIENFLLCPRKWAFDKIDGIEEPTSAHQQLGLDVHDILENYLKFGTWIDTDLEAGQIAVPGIVDNHVPLPKTPGMRVEEWFAIQFGSAAYRGLKDVEIIQPTRLPMVLDHKTTKNFKWQKTEEELLTDIQSGIYAADTMYKTGAAEVLLRWVYYKTVGKREARKTEVVIKHWQVDETLHRVEQTAKRMIHTLQTVSSAIEAEPNFDSCSAYGGCPHKGVRCKVSPSGLLNSIVRQKVTEESRSNKTNNFLANLRQKASGSNGASEALKVSKAPTINAEEAKQLGASMPEPPAPKKIGGKWVMPEYNEEANKWEFPIETIGAEQEQIARGKERIKETKYEPGTALAKFKQRKKAAEGGKAETKSGGSAIDRLKASKKPKASTEDELYEQVKEDAENLAQQAEDLVEAGEAYQAMHSAMDAFVEQLATLVAAKLK